MREEGEEREKGASVTKPTMATNFDILKKKSLLDNSSTNHRSLLHHGNCEALDGSLYRTYCQ